MIKTDLQKCLFEINQDFYQQGVFLNLSGPLSQSLMVEMGRFMKTQMRLSGSDVNTIHKVFSVLVELNQNIIHYSVDVNRKTRLDQAPDKSGWGIISMGHHGGHYFLLSGNVINQHKVEPLRNRLLELQNMTRDQLKAEYQKKRKEQPAEDSKGAGLGLIEMARKASRPLEFRFDPIDADFSFFSLKTTI